jgi:hypothetical protein
MNVELHPSSRLGRRVKTYVTATGRGRLPDMDDLSPDLLAVVRAKAKVHLGRARADCRFWSAVLFYVDRDTRA